MKNYHWANKSNLGENIITSVQYFSGGAKFSLNQREKPGRISCRYDAGELAAIIHFVYYLTHIGLSSSESRTT